MSVSRRSFLRSILATAALTTGLARTRLLVADEPQYSGTVTGRWSGNYNVQAQVVMRHCYTEYYQKHLQGDWHVG